MALSKDYTSKLSFPVNYINTPTDKVIANKLPDKVEVEVKCTGFNLLWFKISSFSEVVNIDMNDSRSLATPNHFYLLNNLRIEMLKDQFKDRMEIVRVIPDTLFLNYNRKITKHVPVKSNLRIKFKGQYQLKDNVKINPASIDISGAEDIVNKINCVETEPKELKNISNSGTVKVGIIKTLQLNLLELSQSTVDVSYQAMKYTEGTIEIPVEIINLPIGYYLKTFPSKVTIKYSVTTDNYEKINAAQFSAIADYKEVEKGDNKLKVQLVKSPATISSVRLNPEKVEYIIRK
jgi:YbbR domain-containing protein